ncbi:hypothetical protein Syun_000802 [Stephania yunnanensis]|uniref:Uncharacterized protein n=1 Tax=Stephania yunnanensis TaxID=152371 RepID=A0AAP0LEC5_9MAGN
MDEYLSEPEETLEVSSHKPDITITHNKDDEVEKEIGVILERSEEPHIESQEDQPLVLVKPLTLPSIFVTPSNEVEVKSVHRFSILSTPFVLDDHDAANSFVLEVSNELPNLKEGMPISLPEYVDTPFVIDILKGEGIM